MKNISLLIILFGVNLCAQSAHAQNEIKKPIKQVSKPRRTFNSGNKLPSRVINANECLKLADHPNVMKVCRDQGPEAAAAFAKTLTKTKVKQDTSPEKAN